MSRPGIHCVETQSLFTSIALSLSFRVHVRRVNLLLTMKPLHAVLLCAYTVVLALILVDPVQGEKDFYELLGVSREASLREIRKAFKKIALTEHPDKKPVCAEKGNTKKIKKKKF